MNKRLGVFAVSRRYQTAGAEAYLEYLFKALSGLVDKLVVVLDADNEVRPAWSSTAPCEVVFAPAASGRSSLHAYAAVLVRRAGELAGYETVVLADASSYGPIAPLEPSFGAAAALGYDLWSMTEHRVSKSLTAEIGEGAFPDVNFLVMSTRLARTPEFGDWAAAVLRDGPTLGKSEHLSTRALFDHAVGAGFRTGTLYPLERFTTENPSVYEGAKLVDAGCPLVRTTLFDMEPGVMDVQVVQPWRALDQVKARTGYPTDFVWRHMLGRDPLRTVQARMKELVVLSPDASAEGRTVKSRVAVVIHAYYAEMMPDFIANLKTIPVAFDLFISTSSEESREKIHASLAGLSFGGCQEVRVVEQNRGRDMSSLFITFRDVFLSDRYDIALRLHSKRTPQVSPHIGEWFKTYLIDNLVASPGFVMALIEHLDENPNVGVVVPAIIHTGFNTMGHSWGANRAPAKALAQSLGFEFPLDTHTPVAAYGTMFWFRPKALRPLFERRWDWTEFNPEPHHVDGGLAHVLERMICYAAQSQGYRTLSVLNADYARIGYVSLEFKLAELASTFDAVSFPDQVGEAMARREAEALALARANETMLERLERLDRELRTHYPKAWQATRPLVSAVWPLIQSMRKSGSSN
jgi:rhamnosyltransferase